MGLPIVGCWVKDIRDGRLAQVVSHPGGNRITVNYGVGAPAVLEDGDWRCGLLAGFVVQDAPLSSARSTLGMATVLSVRELAGREQACVQLHATGDTLWLPYERLRRIMDPKVQYVRAEQRHDDAAERTSLNLMAHALRTWNEATGALERLDVDPLPHQITLVHRILSSGNTNWLIADDVGLGKTIEVGLLLGALERRQTLRRVLLVVPSGLTRQWKEELLTKFDKQYRIWGRDFEVTSEQEWGLYERVIVSLDLAKPQNGEDDGSDFATRFGRLLTAGKWDLVVFDEAHRLSRDEAGRSTLRYRLARALRDQTDAMLLLSGTPHQGDVGRFQNLLRLVRPDLESAIEDINEDASFIGDLVLRNRKIDAVDVDGNFIFAGLMVRRVEIPASAPLLELDRRLADYLQRGYRAGTKQGGTLGRAIGFVMTIYRKLASSSVYALHTAMVRRKQRLLGELGSYQRPVLKESDDTDGTDDLSEAEVLDTAAAFFEEEIALIDGIISQAEECYAADAKFTELRKLASELVRHQGKKLLIFTEYRSTQHYLATRVERLWGKPAALINGGMSVDDKQQAIAAFESDVDILISTEAGGEGLNLHRNCHVMVNYDLPWNPSRLTQRIGRLYRYGQKEQVVVVNFTAKDTIDNTILATVLERLEILVAQMSSVSAEFERDLYQSEVLGELLERLDIADLLEEARSGKVERSEERIAEALHRAQNAKQLQDDILAAAARLDSDGWQRLGAFTTADLSRFIARASRKVGIEVESAASDAERLTLRLPERLRGNFPEFGRRLVIDVRTSRNDDSGRVLLDFASPFVRALVGWVTDEAFGGGYGFTTSMSNTGTVSLAMLVHYQNDQGEPRGLELVAAHKDNSGRTELDNRYLRDLFAIEQSTGEPAVVSPRDRADAFEALVDRIEADAATSSHDQRQVRGLFALGVIES